MVFPYRTPATIEPDLPPFPCASPYLGPGQCAGCEDFRPHPRAFYAQINGTPWGEPERAALVSGLGPWAKAVSAAAVFFLSSASVALGALAWNVTHPYSFHPLEAAQATPRPPPSQANKRREVHTIQHTVKVEDEVQPTLRTRVVVEPILALGTVGFRSHAPEDLWRRAGKLVAAGVDLVLTETTIADRSIEDIERELAPAARILPTGDGRGIQLSILPEGSIARAAGLQPGDLVTAVNGYALSTPDALIEAYGSVQRSRVALIEVQRGTRPVVLKVGFAR
jgi:membrane-associated protease RseP (regulator of RpoE activity)